MPKARVSHWLTEVRTVHSRALSALRAMDGLERPETLERMAKYYPDEQWPDELAQDMRADLEQVVFLLEPYSKEAMKTEGEARG